MMNRYNIIVNRWKHMLLFTAFTVWSVSFSLAQEVIKNYSMLTGVISIRGIDLLVLRKMEKNGRVCYLVVDPKTLATQLVLAGDGKFKAMDWSAAQGYFKGSAYFNALSAASKRSLALQDAGITQGFAGEKGITLTIDLCPSHKPLDRIIFTSLTDGFKKSGQPVPVALSITGRWMLTHTDDLNWLKGLVAKKEIEITWINHSYNHHFSPSVPLKTNFLLEPGTDLNFEVLGTELAMLQHNLMPSVFFRFPGLVSDQRIVTKILDYGIIPVGSDAWLAKGQPAAAGTIVLIHGNGNEPVGVADFIRLLKTESSAIKGKQWIMYDLSETVEDEFGK